MAEHEQDKKTAVLTLMNMRLRQAKKMRIQWESWVATIENFVDGRHRLWFDEEGKPHRKLLMKNEIWRTINLMPGALRRHVNRLTKNVPRWHVKESIGFKSRQKDIDAANAFLQFVYKHQKWRRKIRKIVKLGFKRGWVPVVAGWDTKKNLPTLKHYDAWDFYTDGSPLDEWFWLCVSIPKYMNWIEAQDRFDSEAVKRLKSKREDRFAQSDFKQQWLQQRHGGSVPTGLNLFNQYFVKETFEVENEKTKEKTKKASIFLYEIVGMEILNKEDTGYENFEDFISIFSPEDDEDLSNPRPICSDWIDPQKTIDKVYSSIESYIDIFLHGRWRRTDKSVQIPIGGAHGQVIDAVIGDIEQFDLLPLPQTHFDHFEGAVRQFEQISGVHSESQGRLSGSADAGVAISLLIGQDAENSESAASALSDFLSDVAVKVLKMADKNLKVRMPITIEKGIDEKESLMVIGGAVKIQRAKAAKEVGTAEGEEEGNALLETLPIKPFDQIEVEIVIGTAFSDAQKKEEVKEILSTGYMPGTNPVLDKLLVIGYGVGVQREIMKELKILQDPDRMIASAENQKMKRGEFVTPNASDNHQIHIGLHQQEAKNMSDIGDTETSKLIVDHIQTHQVLLQEGGARTPVRGEEPGSV